MKRTCEYCGEEYEWEEGQPNWGKDNTLIQYIPKQRYNGVSSKRYCSYKCGRSYRYNIYKKNFTEKYGVDNPAKIKETFDKIKQTKLKVYGSENYVNSVKAKETIKKKQLEDKDYYKKIHEKHKKTCLDKYGKVNIGQFGSEEHDQAMVAKYGNKSYINPEKSKETCLKRYGETHYTKTQEYKDLFNNKDWVKQTKEKEYETKKKNHTLYQDIKYRLIQKAKETVEYNRSIDPDYDLKIQQKTYETKQFNQSFNTSKPEEEIYTKLVGKYGFNDIEWQYRSKEYPFTCDFYIKSKDLYIEYQGHWTHGGKPYDGGNLDHQKLVEKWENKLQEVNFKREYKIYYKNAIYVWTKLDPKKRRIVKENNLNWVEFFNLNQFYEWLNKE